MPFVRHMHRAGGGRFVAEAVLDDESALNALSAEMAGDMRAALAEWGADDAVAAVFARGGGERHFCAGGNIRQMYAHIRRGDWDGVSAFFFEEYRLDHALHCFRKPLVGFAAGATMGGGMGVFQGCNIRVADATLKMAMPEVHIGLTPDVGAAAFLRRAPAPLGLFLGMTGATIGAADALFAGLADVVAGGRRAVLDALLRAEWRDDDAQNHAVARAAVGECAADAGASPLQDALPAIAECCAQETAAAVCDALLRSDDAYIRPLQARLAAASADAVAGWHRRWHALADATLEEVFADDYRAVLTMCRAGDFAEGVRALLIDKDNAPKWKRGRAGDGLPDGAPPPPDDADAQTAARLLQTLRAAKTAAVAL